MSCVRVEATRWPRRGFFSFATACLLALMGAPAAIGAQRLDVNNPRYAAIVIDGNSGATLRQANADSLRHPASLTKIMTLYLLFERIESGRIKLTTPLVASAEAASQAPTKLGLKPGQIVTVEDAIKALVTRSANDAAVVVAEALAGSEDEFAVQMTRKARALGMSRTVYRNASGLPDDEQVTTARDQARLAISIQERFPRYYRYFSLTSFTYRGETMRNHNKLLGRVAGVDGIKTGYTHASGYNLVTSVHRGPRFIVAVVLGGSTGAQRDAHMRDLIDRYVLEASVKQPAVNVAQATVPAPAVQARTKVAQSPPIKPSPAPVVEVPAETPTAQAASETPLDTSAERPRPRIVIVPLLPATSELALATMPPASPGSSEPMSPTVVKTVPLRSADIPTQGPSISAYAPAPELSQSGIEASRLPGPTENPLNANGNSPPAETVTDNIPAETTRPARSSPNTWAVQVGAFDNENEAQQRLSIVRSKVASLLKAASPYTERTTKGDKTLYRARFTGLDRTQAEAVCKQLQRNDVGCIALRI